MKKILIISIPLLILCLLAGYFLLKPKPKPEIIVGGISLQLTPILSWTPPTKDSDWAEDVKQESLNVKLDSELSQMLDDLNNSKKLLQKDLDKYINCPECIKYDLENSTNEPLSPQDADNQYNNVLSSLQYQVAKVNQSILRIQNEQRLRTKGLDRRIDIIQTTPSTQDEVKAIQDFKIQLKAEGKL